MRQTCGAGCLLRSSHFRVLFAAAFLLTACQGQPKPAEPTTPAGQAASAGTQPAQAEPQPPIRQQWNFAAEGNAQGWTAANDLAAFEFDAEGLHTTPTGGDPYMVGPSTSVEAAAAYYVEVRMRSTRGSDAQVFWSSNGAAFSEPASQHFEVAPDGGWHTYRIPVKTSPNWKGNITRLRLDPTSQSSGEIGIAFIRILGPAPAQLAVSRFSPTTAFASDRKPFDVQAVLQNTGDVASDDAEYQLGLPTGLSIVSEVYTRKIDAVAPAEIVTLTWPLQGAAGVYAIRLLQADNELGQTNAIVETPDSHETVSLAGDQLRLSFPRQPFGFGVGTLEYGDGVGWRVAGRLQSLGEIVYADAKGQVHSALLYAQDALTAPHSLQFTAVFTDADGAVWRSQVAYALTPGADAPFITVTHTLAADRDVRLLAWRGPRYLPGEGSFGKARDSALFPGLEYLLADDRSSSDRYVAAPLNRRYVPHPNKITIPLMAVTQDGLTTGLMWDPLQRWDGARDRPAALFASPNTWDGQPNHLMALFVPGVTAGLRENAGQLDQPYVLAANTPLTLSAVLFTAAAPETVTPVQLWLDRYGMPGLPAAPRSDVDTLQSALANYQDVVWVPASKGWRYALHDPWGPGYNPGVALHLWLATLDPELKNTTPLEWRDTARGTLDTPPVGGQPNPWTYQPAFLLNQIAPGPGGVEEVLARMRIVQQSALRGRGRATRRRLMGLQPGRHHDAAIRGGRRYVERLHRRARFPDSVPGPHHRRSAAGRIGAEGAGIPGTATVAAGRRADVGAIATRAGPAGFGLGGAELCGRLSPDRRDALSRTSPALGCGRPALRVCVERARPRGNAFRHDPGLRRLELHLSVVRPAGHVERAGLCRSACSPWRRS